MRIPDCENPGTNSYGKAGTDNGVYYKNIRI
jgi:hypothetical protein